MNAWRHGERSRAATEQRREAAELMRTLRRRAAWAEEDAGPPVG
jgi:hypothetical protein